MCNRPATLQIILPATIGSSGFDRQATMLFEESDPLLLRIHCQNLRFLHKCLHTSAGADEFDCRCGGESETMISQN